MFNRRHAFTIVDLLAGLCAGVIILGLLIPLIARADEADTRKNCASNLRQIGQAIMLYCNENKGNYPRTLYNVKTADRPNFYTGVNADDPFGKNGPDANDVTAAMFLLVRTQDLGIEVFTCPAGKAEVWDFGGSTHTAQDRSNFPSGKYLGYSMANPYPNAKAVDAGYKLNTAVAAKFPVAADMNPGSKELTTLTATGDAAAGNSPNHDRQGQNVLFGDGHVAFCTTPFAGIRQDNIYTFGASGEKSGGEGIVGSPASDTDSVLLPVVSKPAATRPSE
ncbi:MAG TPA: hypothetical protein VIL86_20070 [Tepidisphaeraceae bacterium]|jgi:prepilin-type processing-associated H-X9-DG protein